MNEFTPKTQKTQLKYECKICDFNSINKKDYNRHLLTPKHKKRVILNNFEHFEQKKAQTYNYMCKKCDKTYKGRNGLWYHEQKCGIVNNMQVGSSANDVKVLTGLVVDLSKQMLEICKNNNTTNSHNTNSHNNNNNKTFNLQFFLNEECKDAMNLSEFVSSIQLKLSDLENIGKLGYVEGISNIIIKELNDTHLNKRPVHCSDVKRETLYVKQENKWEKDTEQMVKAVKDVDKKATKLLITDWKDANPDLTNSKSNQNKQFIKLAGEVNDGDESNVKKVIKKVAKQIVIDK